MHFYRDLYEVVLMSTRFTCSKTEHPIFICNLNYSIVIPTVYVNDILIGDNIQGIVEIKKYLFSHFSLKNLGRPNYFLRIEIAYKVKTISLYALNLVEETSLLRYKPIDTTLLSAKHNV